MDTMKTLELLTEKTKAAPVFTMATITQKNPLRVRIDGDTDPLPYTPLHDRAVIKEQISTGNRALLVNQGGQYIVAGVLGESYVTGEGPPGVGLEYNWLGSQLGIKREDETEYNYVDLIGPPGEPGPGLEFNWDNDKLGVRIEGEAEYVYSDNLTGPPGEDGVIGNRWRVGSDAPSLEAGDEVGDLYLRTTNGDVYQLQEGSPNYWNQVANIKGPEGSGGGVEPPLYVDTTNNRVGVGVASPDALLHIGGAAEGVRLTGTGTGDGTVAYMSFYGGSVRRGYVGFGSSVNDAIYLTSDNGSIILRAEGSDIFELTDSELELNTNVKIDRGSTNPSFDLIRSESQDGYSGEWRFHLGFGNFNFGEGSSSYLVTFSKQGRVHSGGWTSSNEPGAGFHVDRPSYQDHVRLNRSSQSTLNLTPSLSRLRLTGGRFRAINGYEGASGNVGGTGTVRVQTPAGWVDLRFDGGIGYW